MIILYLVVMLLVVGMFRLIIANKSGLKDVSYGWGLGPKIFAFNTTSGNVRINILPFGEYAKMPMEFIETEDGTHVEKCSATWKQQQIVNSAPIVVGITMVALTTILLKRPLLNDIFRVFNEWISVFGLGENAITYKYLWHGEGLLGFHFVVVSFTILNIVPIAGTPMGFLLGLQSIRSRFIYGTMILMWAFTFLSSWVSVIW